MTTERKNALLIALGIVLIWTMFILFLVFGGEISNRYSQSWSKAKKNDNDIDIQAWYEAYNEAYFLNGLPTKATVVFGNPGQDLMGTTFLGEAGLYIIVSREWNPAPKEAQITLLHEMCHAELIHVPMLDTHGPEWKACMHRLADEGAFDDLW